MTRPIEFHGEVVEVQNNHRHYQAHPEDFQGKTVERFECDAMNAWKIFFTDGTAVAIEAEITGMYGLPGMTLCNTCWKDEK